jgi:phosphoglycolate phosphatase
VFKELVSGIMKEIDIMIFDLDGTLVRSGRDLAASINHTRTNLGLSPLPHEHIMEYVGDGVNKLVERSLGDQFPEMFDQAMSIFMDYYGDHLLDTTDCYPGAREVLEYYNNKNKLIITNKLSSYALRIVRGLNLKGYFDDIIGMDSREYKKPDPRLIRSVIDAYHSKEGRTVVVGDGHNDVLLAKNVGAISCALLNGLGSRDRLLSLEPDYACDDIRELIDLFC